MRCDMGRILEKACMTYNCKSGACGPHGA
jgi:hypothetical protein